MKIGIDLNYRSIDGVLIDNERIINIIHTPIYHNERLSKKRIMDGMYSLIDTFINPKVSGIGISLPSRIDSERGVIYDLSLIPHWKRLKLQRILFDKYHLPVQINNDMNCMALGEKEYGYGKSFSNILCLFFGDTIGVSCLINNQLAIYSRKTFEQIDCLSQSFYIFIRNYSKSFLRTIEELTYYQKKIYNKIEDIENDIWISISILIGRIISILLNEFNPQIVILDGYLIDNFNVIKKHIRTYMDSLCGNYKNIQNIIVPCSNSAIKSLGASTLIRENIKMPGVASYAKTCV